ncbi:hypothetical protein SETIT_9G464900v2 [Setaria italica]|uniref:PGG domain-containing protein n=1 Tax=Setaria italica TaxID=4555 RepID=K4AF41_SETIT|nr:uncharacterized protein LOC101782143 [Setaria italica]RCV45567.1 hypothetical protein SETIT_9G464900v2 [Setaria italica]
MEQQPRVHPNTAPFNLETGHAAAGGGVYPPLPTTHGQSANQQQLGGAGPNSWVGNDANTLLVVAALITTLTYQLGTSIPGGYWQQDTAGVVGRDGKPVMYRAGDPIMRDLHRARYWVFMGASWVGFASSMAMTLSLLVRMPVGSRHVRWSFAVAYSSLVLTFVVSQPKTHLSVDIIVWLAVLAFLWIVISLHPDRRARVIQDLCCSGRQA